MKNADRETQIAEKVPTLWLHVCMCPFCLQRQDNASKCCSKTTKCTEQSSLAVNSQSIVAKQEI